MVFSVPGTRHIGHIIGMDPRDGETVGIVVDLPGKGLVPSLCEMPLLDDAAEKAVRAHYSNRRRKSSARIERINLKGARAARGERSRDVFIGGGIAVSGHELRPTKRQRGRYQRSINMSRRA